MLKGYPASNYLDRVMTAVTGMSRKPLYDVPLQYGVLHRSEDRWMCWVSPREKDFIEWGLYAFDVSEMSYDVGACVGLVASSDTRENDPFFTLSAVSATALFEVTHG